MPTKDDSIQNELQLLELLSRNDVSATFIAERTDTGVRRIVKAINEDSNLPSSLKKRILTTSYNLQQNIKCLGILNALAIYDTEDKLTIEYPYLDPRVWKPISQDLFRSRPDHLLTKICEVVDFLHSLGYVHTDLKLENFMVATIRGEMRLKLIDLDFLEKSKSPLEGRLIGTPAYLAPEIAANEIMLPESDNYSLGQSIRRLLDDTCEEPALDGVPADEFSKGLASFLDMLCQKNRIERPAILIDALLSSGLITESQWSYSSKATLSRTLIAEYRRNRSIPTVREFDLRMLFAPRSKVFGIPESLLEKLDVLFRHSKSQAASFLREIIDSSEVSRFGDFWRLDMGFQALKALERRSQVQGPTRADTDQTGATKFDLRSLRKNARLSRDGRHTQSVVSLHQQFDHLYENSDRSLRRTSLSCGLLLAKTQAACGWITDSIATLHLVLKRVQERPALEARIRWQLAEALYEQGSYLEAREQALLGEEVASKFSLQYRRIEFMKYNAWITAILGDHAKAMERLIKARDEAAELGHKFQHQRTYYEEGVMLWRQGHLTRALIVLKGFAEAVERLDLPDEMFPALVAMSHIHCDLADYDRGVDSAIKGIDILGDRQTRQRIGHAFQALANNLIRLGRYEEAELALNRFIRSGFQDHQSSTYAYYYYTLGWLNLESGKFSNALSHLQSARSILQKSGSQTRLLGKTFFTLSQLFLYKGNMAITRETLRLARSVFEKIGDKNSLTECDSLEIMSSATGDTDTTSENLEALVRKLASEHSIYSAVQGALYMLMKTADAGQLASTKELHETLLERIADSTSPLLNAYRILCDSYLIKQERGLALIASSKTAYKILNSSEKIFLSAHASYFIAIQYAAIGRKKTSEPYYQNALSIARSLGNDHLVDVFESAWKLNDVDPMMSEVEAQILVTISEILNSSGSYEDSLQKLLNAAVELIGAERAAILIGLNDRKAPKVLAIYNCDPDEVADIQSMSMSIINTVAESGEPWRIDDATKDSATSGYKSVVKFNLLSVLCIPIQLSDGSTGILYFDNHIVPSFFNSVDQHYATAIANMLSNMLSHFRSLLTLQRQYQEASHQLVVAGRVTKFISASPKMHSMLESLEEVARHNVSVLLTGETGVGKDLLAHFLHVHSQRNQKPFIRLNCGAIPEDNAMIELFGAKKGAFTGVGDVTGKLEIADGGTLFMDEISELPLNAQAKLLHVVDNQEYQKLGDSRSHSTDIRFVFASNVDLKEMVQKRLFRQDLYYRISPIVVEAPPLRARPEDILPLADHFLGLFSASPPKTPRLNRECQLALMNYSWPGNVRELRNVIERICIFHSDKEVGIEALAPELTDKRTPQTPASNPALEAERRRIFTFLTASNWNVKIAAKTLNVSPATLYRRISRYGLKKPDN